jgi:hypothetical protein
MLDRRGARMIAISRSLEAAPRLLPEFADMSRHLSPSRVELRDD